MSEFHPVAAEMTVSLEGAAVGSVVNNLTTTVEGYALDARQGYVLDKKKLDTEKVANNLATTEEGWALDARQGKYLSDTKVGYVDIVNDLLTDSNSKPLSAAQGKRLQDEKIGRDHVANNLSTTEAGFTLDARQGKALLDAINGSKITAEVSLAAENWVGSGPYTQTVSVDKVTGESSILVSPEPASRTAWMGNDVFCRDQEVGKLTFEAYFKPDEQITVNVKITN